MIAVVILNHNYGKVRSRINFILEAVSAFKKKDALIIVNESIYYELEKLAKELPKRFYKEFEIDESIVEELRESNIAYVPDKIFDDIERNTGTRTAFILDLYNKGNECLEKCLIKLIDDYIKANDQKSIEMIFNTYDVMKSVSNVADHYGAALIPYVFSSIRKVHGYETTLYISHIDNKLYLSECAQDMYKGFNHYVNEGGHILSRAEILAFIGKYRNLLLIPNIGRSGSKKVGFIGAGLHVVPQIYQSDNTTDDDVICEMAKHYEQEEISVRLHPNQMTFCGLTKNHFQNDPVGFILENERFITAQSQLAIKCAMWGKPAVMLGKGLPYSFLFNKDILSEQIMSESDLNFILFCYLVPRGCMFDVEYWNWRKTNPGSGEIYLRHLESICSELGYGNMDILDESLTLKNILEFRHVPTECIEPILDSELPLFEYPFLISRINVEFENGTNLTRYCLNRKQESGLIKTEGNIDGENKKIKRISIFLLDDVDGFVKIDQVCIDREEITEIFERSEKYYKKGEAVVEINSENKKIDLGQEINKIEVFWKVRKYEL